MNDKENIYALSNKIEAFAARLLFVEAETDRLHHSVIDCRHALGLTKDGAEYLRGEQQLDALRATLSDLNEQIANAESQLERKYREQEAIEWGQQKAREVELATRRAERNTCRECRARKANAHAWLSRSVNEIELTVRAANCLNNAGIHTIRTLCKETPKGLLKHRNFGKKSLKEIEDRLAELGLSLAEDSQ